MTISCSCLWAQEFPLILHTSCLWYQRSNEPKRGEGGDVTILEKSMYIRAWFNRLILLSLLLRYLLWDIRNIGSIPPGSDAAGFQVACYHYHIPIIYICFVKKKLILNQFLIVSSLFYLSLIKFHKDKTD